jgi:hypothetical protein
MSEHGMMTKINLMIILTTIAGRHFLSHVTRCLLECVTAAWKALSCANAKGMGTDDWEKRSLD